MGQEPVSGKFESRSHFKIADRSITRLTAFQTAAYSHRSVRLKNVKLRDPIGI